MVIEKGEVANYIFTIKGKEVSAGLSAFEPKSDPAVAIRLLAETTSLSFLISPDKPIKVGETWH